MKQGFWLYLHDYMQSLQDAKRMKLNHKNPPCIYESARLKSLSWTIPRSPEKKSVKIIHMQNPLPTRIRKICFAINEKRQVTNTQ